MSLFVNPDVNLEALRHSTLAHELGHIQLHQGEIESQFISHYGRWGSTYDSRTFQREREADLYAAVVMVVRPSNRVREGSHRTILDANSRS